MSSEFSSLLSLAVSSKFSSSELLENIKIQVLELLREKHPKTPIDAEVILDGDSGKIKIFSDDVDITPSKFADKAESLARQYLINLISAHKSNPPHQTFRTSTPLMPQFSRFFRVLTNLFFWGYNLAFAFAAAIWLIGAFFSKDYSAIKLIASFVLLAIPVSSMVISITRKLFLHSGQLLQTFFIIEVPLILLSIFTISLPEGTNRFLWFTVFNLFLIPLVIFQSQKSYIGSKFILPIIFIKTMTVMVWGYLCLLFTFIVPNLLAQIYKSTFGSLIFFQNYNYYDSYYSTSLFSPGIIISYIISLGWNILVFAFCLSIVLVPYLLFILLYRGFRQETLTKFHGIFALFVLTLSLVLSIQLGPIKQITALETLASRTTSFADKESAAKLLIPQKEKLEKIISQAITTRYSYLFTKNQAIFRSKIINAIFLNFAYPYVYQGPSNVTNIRQAYNLLFTTYPVSSPTQSKSVLLSYRKITYSPTPSGALAEITIEEEYDNQTTTNQEIIYEFSLYPGSVVTDLKLGPDLEFTGQIAPKGAAQKTYESQLRVNRDPALLEQIGSNTYRLRVFPVPGNRDFTTLKGKHQKVSFTYVTTTSPDGFMLPEYTRQTNIYTSSATTHLLSQGDQLTKFDQTTKYLPSTFIPCRDSISDTLNSLRCDQRGTTDQKIAVLLDISLRNKNSPNITQLNKLAIPYDLFKYNTDLSEKLTSSDLVNLVFWGESDLSKVLGKFKGNYDAIFIISGSNKPLVNFDTYPFSLSTPVFFIHDNIPSYELEFLSRIFQSGGQITNSLEDAMQHYFLSQNLDSDRFFINKYFALAPSDEATGALGKLNQLANFTRLVQSHPTNILNNITKLDELNAFAKKAGIVTPYSSLIALVNDQQQQILQNFENQYNRYDGTVIRENLAPRSIGLSSPPIFAPLSGPNFFGVSEAKINTSLGDTMSGGGVSSIGGARPAFASVSTINFGLIFWLWLPILIALPIALVYYFLKSLKGK